MYRGFINQPSTLQEHNNLHGKYCIVDSKQESPSGTSVRVYFTEGAIHSMFINKTAIDKIKLSKEN